MFSAKALNPEGHSRWTLRLLEEQAKIVPDVPVSKDTIGRAFKKIIEYLFEVSFMNPKYTSYLFTELVIMLTPKIINDGENSVADSL